MEKEFRARVQDYLKELDGVIKKQFKIKKNFSIPRK